MQTFLPYKSFERSARCLDRQRLGKQRLECLQILNTLEHRSKGWESHPAVRMWKGYRGALCLYAIAICKEWRRRGYKDTMLDEFEERFDAYRSPNVPMPGWLGKREFHRSHKSNLTRKMPAHYDKYWWNVPDNLPYVWPDSGFFTEGSLRQRPH